MPNIFTSRLSDYGVKNNKYWYDSNYIKGVGTSTQLPNCIHYCVGREGESTNATCRLKLFNGHDAGGYPNAKEAYSKWLNKKGLEPKLGGILCWGSSKDTYGHVAFVEKEPVNLGGNKWKVLVSESCYSSTPSKAVFWRLREYTVEPGKVTSGVGFIYNGCCYNIKDNINPTVNRDKSKLQVAVLVDDLCLRKSANGEKWSGLYVLKGIYNILELKELGNYTWASLSNDCWIALNDKDGWTKTYEPELKNGAAEELKKANAKIQTLEADNNRLKDLIERIKNILIS